MPTKSFLPYLFLMTGILSGCALNPEQCDSTNRDASTVEKFRCRKAYETRVEETQLKLDNAQELNKQFKAVIVLPVPVAIAKIPFLPFSNQLLKAITWYSLGPDE